MQNLESRVKKLSAMDVAILLKFNRNDTSFGMKGETRDMLNDMLVEKFKNEEIDEIELISIESGM